MLKPKNMDCIRVLIVSSTDQEVLETKWFIDNEIISLGLGLGPKTTLHVNQG